MLVSGSFRHPFRSTLYECFIIELGAIVVVIFELLIDIIEDRKVCNRRYWIECPEAYVIGDRSGTHVRISRWTLIELCEEFEHGPQSESSIGILYFYLLPEIRFHRPDELIRSRELTRLQIDREILEKSHVYSLLKSRIERCVFLYIPEIKRYVFIALRDILIFGYTVEIHGEKPPEIQCAILAPNRIRMDVTIVGNGSAFCENPLS